MSLSHPSIILYQLQLFLRGKPRLHERMKRLPNCYRKTPVAKDAKLPDFYEISKTSPLPEVPWSQRSKGPSIAPANPSAAARMTMNQVAMNQMIQPGPDVYPGMGGPGINQYSSVGSSSLQGMNTFMPNINTSMPNNMPTLNAGNLLSQQQGTMQQQQQQQQQLQQPQVGGVPNQDIMQQLLRLSQQQQGNNNSDTALGQLANVSASFQDTSTPADSMSSHQQAQRRISDDNLSANNNMIQLRAIERTNELLTQKLAMLQGYNSIQGIGNSVSADQQVPGKTAGETSAQQHQN